MNGPADDERLARAWLSLALEPEVDRMAKFRQLVALRGAVEVCQAVRGGGLDARGAAPARARTREVDMVSVLTRWCAAGGRFVVPGDAEWPSRLDDLGPGAPMGMWVQGTGRLAGLTQRCVAVVGARACTPYGEHVAAELGSGLGDAGWAVVSGAAFGIDAAAHRGALAVGVPTVAVLAGGADVHYPRSHAGLLERIAADGVVASEQPPGQQPLRNRFLARNRLLAALAPATVVVEAAARSGSLTTADRAARLNRQVLVVPGPVTSALSTGCHRLLRDGVATCVTGAADVLEAVGPLDPGAGAPTDTGAGAPTATERASPEQARVLDAVPRRGGRSTAAVAAEASVELSVARELLPRLEAAGQVVCGDSGWVLARQRPHGRSTVGRAASAPG